MKGIDSIKNSEFARQVLLLATGAGLGQAISFFASLITSRLFTPYEFGILGFFGSVIGVLGVFATGKYDLGIVVVKKEEDVDKLIRLCRRLLFIFGIILTVIGAFLHLFCQELNLNETYVAWMPFSGLAVFLTGYSHVLYMFYTRVKGFKVLTVARILESIALNGLTIAFWFIGSWALLIGLLSAQLIAIIYYTIKIKNYDKTSAGKFSYSEIAKEHIDFPKYNIFLGFLDMYQSQNVILLGTIWFNTAIIGWYAFSMRLLQVPLWLVVRPISHVFFSKASENHRNGEKILPLVKKTILTSLLLAFPFFIVLLIFGPSLFAFFFGEQWRESGLISSILSFWMLLDLVRAPIAQIPVVIGKQKVLLFWTIFGTILSTIAVIMAGVFYSDDLVIAFSIVTFAQCMYSLSVIFVTYSLAKKHDYAS